MYRFSYEERCTISRYLTWLITNIPDHFMNLVVCTQLPSEGAEELIENALRRFKVRNIRKVTWLKTAYPLLK